MEEPEEEEDKVEDKEADKAAEAEAVWAPEGCVFVLPAELQLPIREAFLVTSKPVPNAEAE